MNNAYKILTETSKERNDIRWENTTKMDSKEVW
jgi:hypothetical protein